MDAAFRYLKWNDDVVGLVVPDLSVRFAEPRFNTTVGLYTHGQTSWTPDQFLQFLSERIMSPARRDGTVNNLAQIPAGDRQPSA